MMKAGHSDSMVITKRFMSISFHFPAIREPAINLSCSDRPNDMAPMGRRKRIPPQDANRANIESIGMPVLRDMPDCFVRAS
jgi:hypothetical protein